MLCGARENRPFGLWDHVQRESFVLGARGVWCGESASTAGRPSERVSERARRALGSDAVSLLLRVTAVRCTVVRVSFVDFCFQKKKKNSDESGRGLIILLWSYHFVRFRVCSSN